MNKEQIIHYLKGGKFTATYDPKANDTMDYHKKGSEVEIYQNCLNTPMGEDEYPSRNWGGQYRFSSPDIYGWSPEEDFKNLQIKDEYIDYPESTKKYCYRMTYTEREQLLPNFGKGYENTPLPLVVYREYDSEMDNYVRKLSNPSATTIERRIIDLLEDEQPNWEILKP